MVRLRFLIRRLAAQRLLGIGVVATLAFSIGVMAAGPIYTDGARASIVSASFANASAPTRNVRVDLYAVRGLEWSQIDRTLRSTASLLPAQTIIAQGVTTVRVGPGESSVPMLFRQGAGDHLAFRSGVAPGPGEVAVPAGMAQTQRLRVGTAIPVLGPANERTTLVISGIFDPPTAEDDFWFGDQSPFPLGDSEAPPPVVVSQDTALDLAPRLDLSTHLYWDIYLSLNDLTYAQANTLTEAYGTFATQIQNDLAPAAAHVSSGISTVIAQIQRAVANLRVPILLVLVQILVVTYFVLAGVGVLIVSRQSFEIAVLRSRGFSRGSLLFSQSLQAALAATLALPLGVGIGILLARFAGATNGPRPPGVPFPVRASSASVLFGAATALVGAIVLALPSISAVGRTILDERRQASRESRPILARVPVELFILPVGVFAFLQLRNQKVPAVGAVGTATIDPLLLFAPTFLILGASFLLVRMGSWALASVDGRIGRTTRLASYLAGRRLGRAPGVAFAAALLLVLSMGLLVVATSYRAMTLRSHHDAAHAFVGTDWVAQVATAPSEDPIASAARLPTGMAAVARVQADGFAGSYSTSPDGLAVDPATFGQAAWWRSDFASVSLDALLADLHTATPGAPVPEDARELALTMDAPSVAQALSLRATFARPDGQIVSTALQAIRPGVATYAMDVQGAARLLSITFDTPSTASLPRTLTLGVRSLTLDGSPVPLGDWVPVTWHGASGTLRQAAGGWQYKATLSFAGVVAGLEPQPPVLPAVVSPDINQNELPQMRLVLGGQRLNVQRVGVATSFPGVTHGDPFFLVSAPALFDLQRAIPQASTTVSEVWARGSTDPTDAILAAGFSVTDMIAARPVEAQLAQSPQSLAVGMEAAAAIAGLGLVIAGVAATLYFAQRRRDYEFASLRAMGTSRGTIRRTLVIEQAGLLGYALIAGLLLGWGVLRLMLAAVRSSVGVSYPVPVLVVDWTMLAAVVVVIALASTAALALSIRSLLRSSVTGVLRGEAE
jgi:ABC-type antimicrobial peptide transport system permease subunit